MSTAITFTAEESAYHEGGHFVIAHILGVPLGDIKMIASPMRRAGVSAEEVCDWVREVNGDEGEERFKSFVKVLVAGEEGHLIYGATASKARVGATRDIEEISRLMKSSKDDGTGNHPRTRRFSNGSPMPAPT